MPSFTMRTLFPVSVLAFILASTAASPAQERDLQVNDISPVTVAPVTAIPIGAAIPTGIVDRQADLPQQSPAPARPLVQPVISAQVRDGDLVIDGVVARSHVNLEVEAQRYLYFYAPGVGTAVVSLTQLPGFTAVHNAFNGNALEFAVANHTFLLTSAHPLLGTTAPQDIYVRLDRETAALDRSAMIGYGNNAHGPYAWPASDREATNEALTMQAALLPAAME